MAPELPQNRGQGGHRGSGRPGRHGRKVGQGLGMPCALEEDGGSSGERHGNLSHLSYLYGVILCHVYSMYIYHHIYIFTHRYTCPDFV